MFQYKISISSHLIILISPFAYFASFFVKWCLYSVIFRTQQRSPSCFSLCSALLADDHLVSWRTPTEKSRGFNVNVQGNSGPQLDDCVFTPTCALLRNLAWPEPLIVGGFNTQCRV